MPRNFLLTISLPGRVLWLTVIAGFVLILATTSGGVPPASAAPAVGQLTVDCANAGTGAASVHFEWGPDDAATQIWLDLSTIRNDFAFGTYVSAGPFPTGTRQFTWNGIAAGVTHIYRLRATSANGATSVSFYRAFTPCASAAQVFEPNHRCFGSVANVNFDWAPANPGGTQFLDLSTQDNGFLPGTFISFGPLFASQQMQLWMGITPNVRHYFRVNTFKDGVWAPSATGTFVADCAAQTCALGSERLGRAGQITEQAGLFTYYFDGGTSTADRDLIKRSMDTAQGWNAYVFGRAISAPTCVELLTASSGSVAGAAAGHRILVFAGHPQWQQAAPEEKLLVMVHEHFHVFQAELMRLPIVILPRPWWIVEGSADFIAQRIAADSGIIREELYANFNRAVAGSVTSLADLEAGPGGNSLGAYSLANIAAEYLVQREGFAAMARFFELAPGRDWTAAFQQAFNQPVAQFYAEFEQYRLNGYR